MNFCVYTLTLLSTDAANFHSSWRIPARLMLRLALRPAPPRTIVGIKLPVPSSLSGALAATARIIDSLRPNPGIFTPPRTDGGYVVDAFFFLRRPLVVADAFFALRSLRSFCFARSSSRAPIP